MVNKWYNIDRFEARKIISSIEIFERRKEMTLEIAREAFVEYLLWLLARVTTVGAITILVITLCVMKKGNYQIAVLERELGITTDVVVVKMESIPIEEKIAKEIKALPICDISQLAKKTAFVSIYEEEIIMARAKAAEEAKFLEEAMARNPNLAIRVKGITPTVRMMNTSSYCACEKCCGKTDGITSSGAKAMAWHTVAAGKEYPFGTIIYIPSLQEQPNGGWFIVQDRGGAISSERLDIYLDSHSDALQYGRRMQECYIYKF